MKYLFYPSFIFDLKNINMWVCGQKNNTSYDLNIRIFRSVSTNYKGNYKGTYDNFLHNPNNAKLFTSNYFKIFTF